MASNDDEGYQTATEFASKCPDCGPIVDDEIDVVFPHGAECANCGTELEKVVAVDEPTEVPT